jgi:endonuclease/exonuclease/phosphatase family metal-dependent hydrolase
VLIELTDLIASFSASEVLIIGDFNIACGNHDYECLKDLCVNLNLTQLIN